MLISQKEGFGIGPFSAQLERAEILVPLSLRDFRTRLNPESKLIQVIKTNTSIVHSFNQVSPDRRREVRPYFDLRHYLPNIILPS